MTRSELLSTREPINCSVYVLVKTFGNVKTGGRLFCKVFRHRPAVKAPWLRMAQKPHRPINWATIAFNAAWFLLKAVDGRQCTARRFCLSTGEFAWFYWRQHKRRSWSGRL